VDLGDAFVSGVHPASVNTCAVLVVCVASDESDVCVADQATLISYGNWCFSAVRVGKRGHICVHLPYANGIIGEAGELCILALTKYHRSVSALAELSV
jgi:hypothetical protein